MVNVYFTIWLIVADTTVFLPSSQQKNLLHVSLMAMIVFPHIFDTLMAPLQILCRIP